MALQYVALMVAFFFAMNIGASGTAASMGAAYGSGVITKRWAMILVSFAAFLGASLGGKEVVKTISGGIIPASLLNIQTVLIILLAAAITLFLANLLGIPLSTSEVTVGSIVGVGISYQSVYMEKLLVIFTFWIFMPLVSMLIGFVLGKFILRLQKRISWGKKSRVGIWLSRLLIATGFIEAFSAGMNNVANAVGPVIGAGMISSGLGIILGGAFVGLGAILLGGRVLETNGKKIMRLSILQGSVVSATGGGLVIIASLLGIPVPLTQVSTSAILGVGTAEKGLQLWQKQVIHKILKVWLVSPVSSLVISYTLMHLVLIPNPYVITVILCVFIATVGLASLTQTIRQENRSTINDQGGGI
jgi:sulfate permease